jgi:hypothetical protein
MLRRDDWIRTSDPFVPNEVRYRAALHPEIGNKNKKRTSKKGSYSGFPKLGLISFS